MTKQNTRLFLVDKYVPGAMNLKVETKLRNAFMLLQVGIDYLEIDPTHIEFKEDVSFPIKTTIFFKGNTAIKIYKEVAEELI